MPQGAEMSYSNVDAIYLEYPFLGNIVPRKKVEKMVIRRWNDDLLQKTGLCLLYGGDVIEKRKIYLLDKDGVVITGVNLSPPWKFWKWFSAYKTVGETLICMGNDSKRVRYALVSSGKYDSCWTLYKLPRAFSSVDEWVASEVEAKRNRLRQEG
jgi:hypothetical protein